MQSSYDVAIIGGGPGGSTTASLLRKYAPNMSVAIFERETFPREHVGESLLPMVGLVLNEAGVWDKVEAAGFPIKIGATYRWGKSEDLWDFNLLDIREVVEDQPRPAKFEAWRARTAFQVDRGPFDKILLDHSREMGCHVYENCPISSVVTSESEPDRVSALVLKDGTRVSAKHFVDASGRSGILRKAVGVEIVEPKALQNVAFWDYWDNAEWAVSIGRGGTRVQVMSLGYGWIWFIPISETCTSIGFVCPAEYYKRTGVRPQELYNQALRSEPRISALIQNARNRGPLQSTNDWSFWAREVAGKNWFLVGECAGFADPILAAGITMTVVAAKECAFSIIELEADSLDAEWIKSSYSSRQLQRVQQHIRFAEFWYTANAHFTDLVEFTADIARDAGCEMDADAAWRWLGTGGFTSLETAGGGIAGHSIEQLKNLQRMMFLEESDWFITKNNVFSLDLAGAETINTPVYEKGRVLEIAGYRRNGKVLPMTGGFRVAIGLLNQASELPAIISHLRKTAAKFGPKVALAGLEALESMGKEGWVRGSYRPDLPLLTPDDIPRTPNVDWNQDAELSQVKVSESLSPNTA